MASGADVVHYTLWQFARPLPDAPLHKKVLPFTFIQRRSMERRKEWRPSGDALILRLPSAHVTQILIRDGDSFEVALKRFTRNVQQAGILSEWKRRQRYEPPSVKRKRKAEAQDRKRRRAEAKAKARGY